MNKRIAILIAVLVLAVILIVCGTGNNSKKTDPESAQQTNASSVKDPDNTAVNNGTAEITEPTEIAMVEVTDPVTGETTDARVGIGVEEGEEVPELKEDEPSDPTESTKPTGSTNPTESTEPDETTKPSESTKPTLPNGLDIRDITYEIYMDMTGEEQQAVIAQFGSTEDFMVWFNAVKAIYEAEHPNIEVGGDSTVDGSQIGKK